MRDLLWIFPIAGIAALLLLGLTRAISGEYAAAHQERAALLARGEAARRDILKARADLSNIQARICEMEWETHLRLLERGISPFWTLPDGGTTPVASRGPSPDCAGWLR